MPRANVTDTAARRLQEMILSGELPSGQRLPSQHDLSRQLGISRASLREAVSILETLGFLNIEPGRGTFIASNAVAAAGQLTPRGLSDRYAKQDIYQTRLYIESLIIADVARVATPQTLTTLREATSVMVAAWDHRDLVTIINHDRIFHLTICRACPNPMLRDIYEGLSEEFQGTWRYPLPVTRTQRFLESMGEHYAMVDALEARDSQKAAMIMQEHVFKTAAAAGIALKPLPNPMIVSESPPSA
jgi:GntR family transcriptional regulator, transcriptional repressor for pyruvate dehydrogenase complex